MSRDRRRRPLAHSMARSAAGILPLVALALAGCDLIIPPDAELPVPANIWVINATTDAVRVRVNGEALGGAVPAGEVSFRISLSEGASTVRVEPATGSSLTGGQTITLPANGLGSGQGPTYVLATEGTGQAIVATLMDDSEAVGSPGAAKVRVVHAAGLSGDLDIWYSNAETPTLTRVLTPFAYGVTSDFIESNAAATWRIVVTPRMTPTPGEDPEAAALADFSVFVGFQGVQTLLVQDGGSGVRVVVRPAF